MNDRAKQMWNKHLRKVTEIYIKKVGAIHTYDTWFEITVRQHECQMWYDKMYKIQCFINDKTYYGRKLKTQ